MTMTDSPYIVKLTATLGDDVVEAEFALTIVGKLTKPNITATTVDTFGDVTVTWKAVKNAYGYRLEYATNSSKTFTTVELTADQLSYTIEGLRAGTAYKVRLRAIGAGVYQNSDAQYRYFTTPLVGGAALDSALSDDDMFEILAASILG